MWYIQQLFGIYLQCSVKVFTFSNIVLPFNQTPFFKGILPNLQHHIKCDETQGKSLYTSSLVLILFLLRA